MYHMKITEPCWIRDTAEMLISTEYTMRHIIMVISIDVRVTCSQTPLLKHIQTVNE